jgi:hypothetical protein
MKRSRRYFDLTEFNKESEDDETHVNKRVHEVDSRLNIHITFETDNQIEVKDRAINIVEFSQLINIVHSPKNSTTNHINHSLTHSGNNHFEYTPLDSNKFTKFMIGNNKHMIGSDDLLGHILNLKLKIQDSKNRNMVSCNLPKKNLY